MSRTYFNQLQTYIVILKYVKLSVEKNQDVLSKFLCFTHSQQYAFTVIVLIPKICVTATPYFMTASCSNKLFIKQADP